MIQDRELLEFHRGTIDEDTRLKVEEQLLDSQVALMSYIALKRSLELTHKPELVPSEQMRTKLMSVVRQRIRQRPVLYWTLAAATAAAIAAVVLGVRALTPHDLPPSINIDADNNAPVTLNVL